MKSPQQHHPQWWRAKAFPLRSGPRRGFPLSPVIHYCTEVLARAIRQEKEMKGIQIGKGEVKLSLFTDNMVVYVKKPRRFHVRAVRTNKVSKAAGCKNQLHFYTHWTAWKGFTRIIPVTIASKTNYFRVNKGGERLHNEKTSLKDNVRKWKHSMFMDWET